MTEVLDSDQACEYLKLAKVTLYKHVRSGQIPAFKMGRVWRFHKGSLERWIEDKIKDDTKATSERAEKKRGSRG